MSFRLEIKKEDILIWANGLVVIVVGVTTVLLALLGRLDYLSRLFSFWFYIPALLVSLALVYAAYRRWSAPHERSTGRT